MQCRSRLSRRRFVAGASAAGLGLVAGCWRLPWQGQPTPRKVPTIGWLRQRSGESTDSLEPAPVERLEAFRQGLAALGYVEGQHVVIEQRLTETIPSDDWDVPLDGFASPDGLELFKRT